jgi:poly-beta-1,6-N-acetyl-D-glucosamine synthase
MKPLIIILALNESKNIESLIKDIKKEKIEIDILVVDGSATDGTYELVKNLSEHLSGISLLKLNEDRGFENALALGFQWGLDYAYDPIITMNGDGSHGPEYIKCLIAASHDYDLIIASRYINGVRVEGWRFRKLLLSKLANMFISYLLVKPIWDFTSGFRCYSRNLLESIDINKFHSIGYVAQIRLLSLAFQKRFRVKEIPFIYKGNYGGISKLGRYPKIKTLTYLLKYRAPLLEIFRHFSYLRKDYSRFVEEYDEFINPPKLKERTKYNEKDSYTVSVGVIAHNEEKIIGRCLEGLINQKIMDGSIDEIVVVSSASTDGTDKIVETYQQKDNRIHLITQEHRLGKAKAINEFLSVAKGDIIVVESADTVPDANAIQELIHPFHNPDVGMTGAHPVPINDGKKFIDFCVKKLWQLHHYIAMDSPKCGEMIAFLNIVPKIPAYTAVDEAVIEGILIEQGLKLVYANKAIVRNKGPETMGDFIKQRRRIAAGHKHLKASMRHEVSTGKSSSILRYVLKYQRWTPKEVIYMSGLMIIEAYSRLMGLVDYYIKDKNPFIWDIARSTKRWI